MKLVEPVQMNMHGKDERTPMENMNILRKDLNWLHCDVAPKVHGRQQVKEIQSYISAFIAYLTFPSSN